MGGGGGGGGVRTMVVFTLEKQNFTVLHTNIFSTSSQVEFKGEE